MHIPKNKKNQTILLVVQNNSFPTDKRVLKEARSLKNAGYIVSIISPASEFDPEYESTFEEMNIFRYRNFESQGGIGAFFLEYANAVIKIFFLSLKVYFKKRFRIIHVANPPDFFWPMALFYKPFGVKVIFDQHDIAPEMLRANQGRAGILYRLLLFNEHLTVLCASAIITVNQSLKQRLLKRYTLSKKIFEVVYNGPNANFKSICDSSLSAQHKGKKIILFVGLMAPLDGVETLIHVAENIVRHRSDCVFILLGDGPERPRLEQMVKNKKLEKQIVFKGRVSYETVKKYLALASVCVAPDEKNEFTDHFTLVKVLEYMKAGKPFVGFRLHETCLIAGDAGCYANSLHEFIEQVEYLLDNPDSAEKYGSIGQQIIEKEYLWEHQEERLLNVYQKLLG